MAKLNKPISLLMIDIEKFKSINDRFGHPAGDAVILATGKLDEDAAKTGFGGTVWRRRDCARFSPARAVPSRRRLPKRSRKAIGAKPVKHEVLAIPADGQHWRGRRAGQPDQGGCPSAPSPAFGPYATQRRTARKVFSIKVATPAAA